MEKKIRVVQMGLGPIGNKLTRFITEKPALQIVGAIDSDPAMHHVEIYGRVRQAVLMEGRSLRSVSREFGLARVTVRKMLGYAVPPGYRRQQPVKPSHALQRLHQPRCTTTIYETTASLLAT